MRGNHWREALTRYEGDVPSPWAVYRPPVMGDFMPYELGICSFRIPAVADCHALEEYATAIADIDARFKEIQAEFGVQPLDDEHRAEWNALRDARAAFIEAQREAQGRINDIANLAQNPGALERHAGLGRSTAATHSRLPENLFDLPEYRTRTNGAPAAMAALMCDGAKKIAEQAVFPHPNANRDKAVERIHRLLTASGDDPTFPMHFIGSADPIYQQAWVKLATGRADLLTPSERAAVATVGSTTAGGYAVPVILDPAVIPTSDGATNPIRSIARVETLTGAGNTWKGVTSGGIVLAYGPAENGGITETTSPIFGQPEVTVQPVKGELKYSIEAPEDWPRMLAELALQIQDAKDVLEADKFVNGTGSGFYPEGIVYGLAASSLVGTEGDGFDSDDIYRFINRLPPRFKSKAVFLGNPMAYDAIAQFIVGDTSDSRMYIRGQGGNPGSILSWPAYDSSEMEDDVESSGNKILVFGDFRYYLVVDKVGLSVEDAGFVRDGDGKLTGQKALFIHYRNSAVILADNAFRLLKTGVVTS